MILYGAGLSPYVRKVLVYGAEKGLGFDLVPAGLGDGGPDFFECSPFGKMPAFRDRGADDGHDFTISDSSAIIAYLEAKHPAPTMIPADPIQRARVVWFEEFADTIVIKMGAAVFFNRFVAPKMLQRPGNEDVAVRAIETELPPILDYLERAVPDDHFLVGGAITLADVAVASPFVNLRYVDVIPDAARWPRASAYLDAIHARPAFVAAIASERRSLEELG